MALENDIFACNVLINGYSTSGAGDPNPPPHQKLAILDIPEPLK